MCRQGKKITHGKKQLLFSFLNSLHYDTTIQLCFAAILQSGSFLYFSCLKKVQTRISYCDCDIPVWKNVQSFILIIISTCMFYRGLFCKNLYEINIICAI